MCSTATSMLRFQPIVFAENSRKIGTSSIRGTPAHPRSVTTNRRASLGACSLDRIASHRSLSHNCAKPWFDPIYCPTPPVHLLAALVSTSSFRIPSKRHRASADGFFQVDTCRHATDSVDHRLVTTLQERGGDTMSRQQVSKFAIFIDDCRTKSTQEVKCEMLIRLLRPDASGCLASSLCGRKSDSVI